MSKSQIFLKSSLLLTEKGSKILKAYKFDKFYLHSKDVLLLSTQNLENPITFVKLHTVQPGIPTRENLEGIIKRSEIINGNEI